MTIDEYASKLGKFWINFNSLELLLRMYLTKHNRETEVGLEIDIGGSCPLSHLTNYDTFETLAEKYNATLALADRIDVSDIVRLRDAIAHGRVLTKAHLPDFPLTVVKFSKPDRGRGTVNVTFKEVLTASFLDRCINNAYSTARKVADRLKNEFPEAQP